MLFHGDILYMLPSQDKFQSMGFALKGENHVIVVDGGGVPEAEQLGNFLLDIGGTVGCWFITHPHSDHIGAVIEVLKRDKINVKQICYQFPPIDYIKRIETREGRTECATEFECLVKEKQISRVPFQMGQEIKVGNFGVIPLSDGAPAGGSLNLSSVVYRVNTRGESILFLGDLHESVELKVLSMFPDEIQCAVVQMAHHGQQGVSEKFYQKVQPRVCLWPTPEWLWNNDNGQGYGTGPYKTLETRAWMEKLDTVNYRFEEEITVIK